MDRQTAICILFAILIAVAVTCWSFITGDWQRAEGAMFDGLSPEARTQSETTAAAYYRARLRNGAEGADR